MPLMRRCLRCDQLMDLKPGVYRCPTCEPLHQAERNKASYMRNYSKNQDKNRNSFYRTAKWQKIRRLVIQRDGHKCYTCQGTERLTVHHLINRKAGGSDSSKNLITLCHSCHNRVEKATQFKYSNPEIRMLEQEIERRGLR